MRRTKPLGPVVVYEVGNFFVAATKRKVRQSGCFRCLS